jgi:Undecaprenyl-phosphate glucose phosphotransferase
MDHYPKTNALAGGSTRVRPQVQAFSYRTVGRFAAILDYLLIISACFVAGYGYELTILQGPPSFQPYFGIANLSAIVFVMLSHQLYRPAALISLPVQIRGILFNWIVLFLIIALMLFLLKIGANQSRGALATFGVLGLAALGGSRLVICPKLNKALAHGNLAGYPAILIGNAESLRGLTRLELLQRFGAHEISRFEVRADDKQLTILDEAIETAREQKVEWVLLALHWDNESLRKTITDRIQVLPLPVFLLPDRKISSVLAHPTRQIGSEFTVEIQRPPLSPAELVTKRAMDIALCGAILVTLIPLLVIVSILIKFDSPGPVIFRQRRKGFNGHQFTIYKFRTMKVLEDGDVISQARRDDIRVTRLGRLLRATSIDELPQLINVLRGQMSLVGPRPHAVAHDNGYGKLISNYAFRQHVKPGLTGWAQVRGFRGETSQLELMERRVALDLWYIQNWSIWLDFRIIALTFFELVRHRNAY